MKMRQSGCVRWNSNIDRMQGPRSCRGPAVFSDCMKVAHGTRCPSSWIISNVTRRSGRTLVPGQRQIHGDEAADGYELSETAYRGTEARVRFDTWESIQTLSRNMTEDDRL